MVQLVGRDSDTAFDSGNGIAAFSDLFDDFNLELFTKTLPANDTSEQVQL